MMNWLKGKSRTVIFGSLSVICASAAWIIYRYNEKKKKTLYSIKDIRTCKHLLTQTVELLESEWDSSARHPFLNEKDLNESDKPNQHIPCHHILIEIAPRSIFDLDTMNEKVIGHIYLRDSVRSVNINRLRKMVAIKMPINAIKQRAKHAGVDLNDPISYDEHGNLSFDHINDEDTEATIQEIYIGSLLVHASFRRLGFAKLLLSHSLLFVHQFSYRKLYGAAAPKLIAFYEKLGGKTEAKRVYKTNTISMMITDQMIDNCRNVIKGHRRLSPETFKILSIDYNN